jgi:hypothetical protein
MNRDDDPELIPRLLEQRGYTRVVRSLAGHERPEVSGYKAPPNGADVTGYVWLEKKQQQDAYDVAFGVTCNMAVELLGAADHSLRGSTAIPAHVLDIPRVALFSAGRLLKCALINIPDRSDPRTLHQLLDELVSKVLRPFVEEPNSCPDVLTTLRRNDMPFEWAATNPVKRAIHLAATARVLGIHLQEVETELRAVRDSLRGVLARQEVWDSVIRSVVAAFWSPIRARN